MNNDLIRYACHSIDDEDIAEVISVLKSPMITQGPKIVEFEENLAAFCDARFGIATSSGSGALHVACMAADVGPGDEVITSPNTFVASAVCAAYCKAKPVFADIDLKTYNVTPSSIEAKLSDKTRAVIPVHFAGQSCDMEGIQAVVRKAEKKYGRKIFIIEDAAHALGSRYQGKKIGSCPYSDVAVMSFHPVKHITTAEGGILLTHNASLAARMMRLRSHGITSTPEELINKEQAHEPAKKESGSIYRRWYYEQQFLGHHYRTTDLQCALGVSQLRKLPRWIQRRREIVNFYHEYFQGMEKIQKPYEDPDCGNNLHLYVLLIDFSRIPWSRPELIDVLRGRRIQTQVHYIPVYTQPIYRQLFGTRWGDCPNCEIYYKQCLSIPLYPTMTDDEVSYVAETVSKLCR